MGDVVDCRACASELLGNHGGVREFHPLADLAGAPGCEVALSDGEGGDESDLGDVCGPLDPP